MQQGHCVVKATATAMSFCISSGSLPLPAQPCPTPGRLTKTDANAKRDEFMRTVNGSGEPEVGGIRPVLLREFLDQKHLPFQRGKWKKSTQGTSENRIMHHVVKGLGDTALKDFSLTSLQAFLESKADEDCRFPWWTICAGISARFLKWLSRKK